MADEEIGEVGPGDAIDVDVDVAVAGAADLRAGKVQVDDHALGSLEIIDRVPRRAAGRARGADIGVVADEAERPHRPAVQQTETAAVQDVVA